jgi:hypothetical protein
LIFFFCHIRYNVIPIAMGAPPEDYNLRAPLNSYIHTEDFDSPKDLATYLHKLDKDDKLYNEYFQWKGTGEFINTHLFCRVCAMLHVPDMPRKNYNDLNKWYEGPGDCIRTTWREHRAKQAAATNILSHPRKP